jgi:serine/threonine protein kinase
MFRGQRLEDYGRPERKLSQGAYGRTYVTETGYVVKVSERIDKGELDPYMLNEIVLPTYCQHPGVIQYHDVYITPDKTILVMDRYEGDLRDLIDKYPAGFKHHRQHFIIIAYQLVTTLAYLASRNIIHRDIKPDNIFFRTCLSSQLGYKVVIGDFGLGSGKECLIDLTKFNVYTAAYRPPEILLQWGKYGSRSDVWALGCTLYEFYTGQPLFTTLDVEGRIQALGDEDILQRIFNKIEPPLPFSRFYEAWIQRFTSGPRIREDLVEYPIINDFLLQMLTIDPNIRADIFQLQQHPLFDDIRDKVYPNSCYSLDTVIANTCADRVELFSRNFAYDHLLTTAYVPHLSGMLTWLLGEFQAFQLSKMAAGLMIDLVYRYFTYYRQPIPYSDIRLVGMAGLYLANVFIDRHYRDAVYITKHFNNEYPSSRIVDMAVVMVRLFHYDLCATIPYDRIQQYQDVHDEQILDMAKDLILIASPIVVCYSWDRLVPTTIATVASSLDKNYTISEATVVGDIKWLMDHIRQHYHGDIRALKMLKHHFTGIYHLIF